MEKGGHNTHETYLCEERGEDTHFMLPHSDFPVSSYFTVATSNILQHVMGHGPRGEGVIGTDSRVQTLEDVTTR